MRYITVFYLLLTLLYACVKNESSFIELQQYRGSNRLFSTTYNRDINTSYANFLIAHAPEKHDKAAIKRLLVDFCKHKIDSVKKSGTDVYTLTFYRNTRNTAYFINRAEDPGGFSSEELSQYCITDGLGELRLERCKYHHDKWSLSIAYNCNTDGYFDNEIEVLSNDCK